MSFGVFQQLAPSALVDRSIFASFTASDVNDLVLIRGDYLEIYHLQRRQNRLSYALGQQLFGRCEALVAFRPDKGGSADHLALLFRRARYLVVLRYDPELGNIATCGQHVLIPSTESVLPEAFQPKLTVDPEQRCLLAHALPDRLVLFPTTKGSSLRPDSAQLSSLHQDDQSGLRAPFNIQAWSQLRLHHVTDVAFLGGYHQPTMACLGQAKPSWCGCISERSQESSVLIFVLDVTRQVRLIWATHGLPDDAFRILPMPPPISGVFSISPNSVTYLKEHGSSISQALNMAALERKALAEKSEKSSMRNESKLDILLADCSAVVLSPTVILFSIHPSGRLYLAHLVLTGRDAVTDIVWTSPAQHMPAWSMCCSRGEDFVCLVDTIGAVSLLRAQVSKKKLPGTLQPLKRMRLHEPGEVPLKPTEKLKELMDLHEQLRDAFRFLRSYTFERIDELPSTGPLQSLQLWCNDRGEENQSLGTQRFIACGGTDSKGSLQIMQRAVPLEEQVEFDLPKGSIFSAVWTLRQAEDPVIQGQPRQKRAVEAAAPPHRYVLISSAKRSMLLETTEEIEEISQSRGLEMAMSTVGAGSICDGKVLVQLTPKSAFFMRATPEAGAAPPSVPYPSKSSASGGSVADPFVLLRLEDKTIKLLTMTSATNTGQVVVRDLTTQLPEEIRGEVLWASLWKDLLVVLLPTQRGTVSVLQLHGGLGKPLTLREVFRSPHLGDVPPVLRSIVQTEEEDEDAKFNASLDYLRPITDVCATLPRSSVEVHLARQGDEKGAANVLSAELVDVDPDDEGPTLVLLVKGRPILFYRAMVARGPQGEKSSGAFPYSFSLVEHDFLGLVMDFDGAPYRPVSPLQDAVGRPSGAVCCAPHSGLPALWIGAKRNRFFIHPFPGKTYRGVAPLSAACVASGGFFSLLESDSGGTVAQVSSPATVEGLGSAGSFDLRQSIPCARLSIKKKPSWMATQGSEGLLGVAVSDMVVELNDVPAGPGMEEDPLSEDWSIIREAPVKVDAPPAMPRVHPRYELWIETSKELSKLGRYHFSFDNEEAVLSMSWVNLPGFPLSLAVGTGVNTGEDLTCRGRLMLFTIKDKEPGILPPVYQRSLRSPVTVVGQSGSNFIHAEGFKLYVEKWENSSFNKLALFDGSLCMTSMSNIKNFMLFGDLRKGVDFCQWKEEQSTGTRTIRRLSRSPPSMNMTVLACEFVIHQKSLGLVALDHKGNVHLYQYTPHSDGREGDQILRSCATFAMGAPCRSALRLQTEPGVQSLLMASGTGEVFCCRPIDDQAYRTITTLLGMLFTRLPFRCGLNPRAYRSDAQIHLLTPRKNIEDAVLLKSFAFLSQPLQNSIAEKMRLPLPALMRATVPYGSNVLG